MKKRSAQVVGLMFTLTLSIVLFSVGLSAADDTSNLIDRRIWDCSLGDGECFSGKCLPEFQYCFGRREGEASVGDAPDWGARKDRWGSQIDLAGNQDVDNLYRLLGQAHLYYLSKFNRNGANRRSGTGDGVLIPFKRTLGFTHTNWWALGVVPCPNAYFFQGHFSFCSGTVNAEMVGHEYAHAVQRYSVRDKYGKHTGLNYAQQSGAIAEGLSEFFAEAFELFDSNQLDWLRHSPDGALIDLSDPERYGHPASTYSDNYVCQNLHNDFGGVHQNSTVVSHLAYLISVGNSKVGCSISGLGIGNTEKLFYQAAHKCLRTNSGYIDLYRCLLLSCASQFSAAECTEVLKAVVQTGIDQPGKCESESHQTLCVDIAPDCKEWREEPLSSVCRCGEADLDENKNGVRDCLESYLTDLKPKRPAISKFKDTFRVRMGKGLGLKKLVKIRIKRPNEAPIIRYRKITASLFLAPQVAGPAICNISYYYLLPGKTSIRSKPSRRVRLTFR
ncbi:M4 family metallopeptidase [Oligoflexia bacterium]|nr:M4 family metallopeptidase [Oligoflexia bacterium]